MSLPNKPTPLTHQDLEMIRDEIARLERTVQGLLDFAKPHPMKRTLSDVRQAISRAGVFATARAQDSNVTIRMNLGNRPLVAAIDPDHFVSLFSNLIINAIDASPSGGVVEVESSRTTQGSIQIMVCDTGPGISPEMKDLLFSPYTTSKPAGTGLGLAIAHRVALDHHGSLTAVNRPTGAATMTVTIPALESDYAETSRY